MLKRLIKTLAKKAYENNLIPYSILEEPEFYIPTDSGKLKQLKDKFKGERCFIIGNGPSLNKLDLTKLKDEYSFGVNGFFYKTDEIGIKPTFYVVEDTHVMADNQARINDYQTDYRFFPTRYKKFISNRENTYFFKMNRGFYEQSSPNFGIPRFSTDISKRIYCGQSVTIMNLQLAYYLGFDKVYLIGMDFSYNIPKSAIVNGLDIESTDDDENHFHPEYFGKGKRWHDPQLDKVLLSYKQVKLCYEANDRAIYNATCGGKLELFERVDFDSLFEKGD